MTERELAERKRIKKTRFRRAGWTFAAEFLVAELLAVLLVVGAGLAPSSAQSTNPSAYMVGSVLGTLIVGFLLWLVLAVLSSPLVIWLAIAIPVPPEGTTKRARRPEGVTGQGTAEDVIRRSIAEKRDRHLRDLAAFEQTFKDYEEQGSRDSGTPGGNDPEPDAR